MGAPNLQLGHEAVYIGWAYAVSALVLAAMVVDSVRRAARWRRSAERARPDDRPAS